MNKALSVLSSSRIASLRLHRTVVADTMPSPLDTDNAWIELSVYIIPCRMCKRFCKAVMENSEIAAKYEWSRKADNESFFEMLRSAERLDEERKTNSVNHRITFRRYAHRPTHRGYKRETAFAVALIALYGMGVGYFIAGLWTFAIGFVVAATVLLLIFSLVKYISRCFH
ncbi:hypothetical protein D918_06756 [Trichuris suis]|nr:hypothetical protein D918_06756 [Trichuris suis]